MAGRDARRRARCSSARLFAARGFPRARFARAGTLLRGRLLRGGFLRGRFACAGFLRRRLAPAAALLAAAAFLVHGCPGALRGGLRRNALLLVAFLDVLGLALLLAGVGTLVSTRH